MFVCCVVFTAAYRMVRYDDDGWMDVLITRRIVCGWIVRFCLLNSPQISSTVLYVVQLYLGDLSSLRIWGIYLLPLKFQNKRITTQFLKLFQYSEKSSFFCQRVIHRPVDQAVDLFSHLFFEFKIIKTKRIGIYALDISIN